MKGGRISDYNGKSISVTGGSTLLVDPELEDVSWLHEWMVASYDTTNFVHVTNSSSKAVIYGTKTVSEMLSINLKVSEFSAIFRVIVSVKEIQTGDFYYPACMKVVNGRQCSKKVTQVSESMWQCNSCDSDSGDIQLKYALHLCILDSTGHIWAVAFDDAANEIVGMPACKLAALQDDDYTSFSAIMDSIRSKMYNLK
ncbi:replication factor A protein 1, partial [Selaginella moellendorffii]